MDETLAGVVDVKVEVDTLTGATLIEEILFGLMLAVEGLETATF